MSKITDPTKINYEDFFAAKTSKNRIMFLLRYAALAPSTHNTQPWKVKVTNNSCEVYIDNSRQLPEADPDKKYMYISIGAFIKNLEVAAQAFSVYKETVIANKKNNLVAVIYFRNVLNTKAIPKTKNVKLLESIQTRTNYRGQFKKVKIDSKLLSELNRLCSVDLKMVTDKKSIVRLGELTSEGLKAAYKRPSFRKEISSWINSNLSKRQTGIPGYSLRMPTSASFIVPKVMKFLDIGDKLARSNYQSFASSSAVAVLYSSDNDQKAWVEVGRSAQAVILWLELKGISSSIFVAAVENQELNPKVKDTSGIGDDLNLHFLFCIGLPALQKVYSPREDIKTKLYKSS